jgi:hypothetical protein
MPKGKLGLTKAEATAALVASEGDLETNESVAETVIDEAVAPDPYLVYRAQRGDVTAALSIAATL